MEVDCKQRSEKYEKNMTENSIYIQYNLLDSQKRF